MLIFAASCKSLFLNISKARAAKVVLLHSIELLLKPGWRGIKYDHFVSRRRASRLFKVSGFFRITIS